MKDVPRHISVAVSCIVNILPSYVSRRERRVLGLLWLSRRRPLCALPRRWLPHVVFVKDSIIEFVLKGILLE